MDKLFVDQTGKEYTTDDVCQVLKEIGADECDTLFIHSDILFGTLSKGLKRKDYLQALYDAVEQLHVTNLIIPTFTYSFCNHEDYDVRNSATSMGAFNEYIRKMPGRSRTLYPLLSLSVPENLRETFSLPCDHSLGSDSGFDILHRMENVKFLFLGARLGNCFTYVHYVEKMLDVPYRFDMPFSGRIIDAKGAVSEKTQYIHTACYGVRPADYYYFEDYLEQAGHLKKQRLGNLSAACISERDAYREIAGMLKKNIHYFLEVPFREEDLVHKYTKGLDGERITHC